VINLQKLMTKYRHSLKMALSAPSTPVRPLRGIEAIVILLLVLGLFSKAASASSLGTSNTSEYTTPSIVQPAYDYPASQLVMINNFVSLDGGYNPPLIGSLLWVAVIMPVSSSIGCFQFFSDTDETLPCTTAGNTWIYDPGTPDLSGCNLNEFGCDLEGAAAIGQFDAGVGGGGIECSIPYGYYGQASVSTTGTAQVDTGCNQSTGLAPGLNWELSQGQYTAQTVGDLCNNYALPQIIPNQLGFGERPTGYQGTVEQGNTLATGQYIVVSCWFEGAGLLYDCQNSDFGVGACLGDNPDVPGVEVEDFQVEPIVNTQIIVQSTGLGYGLPGSPVTVQGQGFAPDATVDIAFDGAVETSATADSSGSFGSVTFSVPSDAAPGGHEVTASDQLNNNAGTAFQVLGTSPSISLWPQAAEGPVSSKVLVVGTDFTPIALVIVKFDGNEVAVGETDGSGSFSQTFIVPDAPGTYLPGANTVSAVDSSGRSTSETFTVTSASLSFSPSSGPPGSTTSITGTGFTPNDDYTICIDNPSTAGCVAGSAHPVITDASGGFSLQFPIPADAFSFATQDFLYISAYQYFYDSEFITSSTFALTSYSVTFQQTGIPTSGVTWGVTVGGIDYKGDGASIVVPGLSGTLSYAFDSPISGPTGTQYVCPSSCSGSVSAVTTIWAAYQPPEPSYCTTIGGSWDGVSTCTFSGSYAFSSGTLEITSGTTLVISNSGSETYGITVHTGATLTVDGGGAITIENSGTGSSGILVEGGTFTSSGTITTENAAVGSNGIWNYFGTFTSSGTITIANAGMEAYGILNYNGGTFTSSGTITIETSGTDTDGIVNDQTFSNYGTVAVENSGSIYGIWNNGGIGATLTNYGTLTVENSGTTGIYNYNGAAIINECDATITVENTGGTGIANEGGSTITNNGGSISGYSGTVTQGTECTTSSVTFDQTGIPSAVTWGVTVGGTHYTGTGGSITVNDLTGTVAYSYDSPIGEPSATQYTSSCSGSVTGAGTQSCTYTAVSTSTQYCYPPTSGSYACSVENLGTAISVTFSGYTGSGLASLTTQDYGVSPQSPTPADSIAVGGVYYDVQVSGSITDGIATVCIPNPGGATTMAYYISSPAPGSWDNFATIVGTPPTNPLCGQIPIADLYGTPIVLYTPSPSSTGVPEFPFGIVALLALIPALIIIRARLSKYGRII